MGEGIFSYGQNSEDVENQDSPERPPYSLWDIMSRMLRLASRDRNHLCTQVREYGIYKTLEETQKPSGRPRYKIRLHSSGITPVLEAYGLSGRATANDEDEGHD